MNSNAPLVSVVIPTYSRSDMLTRAMESVNAQTYPNIEIVVVDDNGKGTNQQLETQARVLAFETRPGVELHYVVREKNGGGSLARNTGIDASKADFVAFLDDDDEFLPRKLELQMEPMSDSNVSLTYAHCKGVQPDGTEIYYRRVCNGVPVFEQAYCGDEPMSGAQGCVTERRLLQRYACEAGLHSHVQAFDSGLPDQMRPRGALSLLR